MKNSLVALLIFGMAFSVHAKDVYDLPEVTPIINQLYPSAQEFSINLAYFPIGAFNKHIGLGGSYLSFPNPNHAWEVLSAYYFMESASGLKKTLIESWGAKEENFAVLQYLVKTGYSYVPFYSKSILFNSYLVHSRTLLNVSAGLASFKIEQPPMLSVGFGQNFYFGEGKGIKFEVDYLHFFKSNAYIQDQLTISLGLVFAWGENE